MAKTESEILIVDEVLAVGDAEFQKKCLGKMGDISKGEGRTVLFVSHNMGAVKTLCSKGIVLQNGLINFSGDVDDAIDDYLKTSNSSASRTWTEFKRPGVDFINLIEAKVLNENNEISLNHAIAKEIKIQFTYEITKDNQLFTHGFNLFNNHIKQINTE